jgi:hypothetical protein
VTPFSTVWKHMEIATIEEFDETDEFFITSWTDIWDTPSDVFCTFHLKKDTKDGVFQKHLKQK